jgi:CheY-like chemotaxis protein
LLASQVDVLTTEASESTDGEMDVRADAAASDGAGSLTYAEAAEDPQPSVRRILWVGDDPESSTYEIAALQDRGVEVVQSQSTRDAISKLANLASFDAVVTGMERFENGQLRPTAGLELINWIANSGPPVPVVVYASRHTARQYRSAVLEAGGLGATASATELFELLGVNFGPLSGSRLESEVLRIVKEGKAGEVSDLGHHGPVDVVMQRNGRRIGIEVKGWIQIPAPRAVKDVVSRLSNLVAKGEFDEVWLVTARPIDDPRPDTDEHREAVRVLSIEQLRDLVGVCSTGAALRSS